TTNAAMAGKLQPTPGFDNKFFPVETPHLRVFEAHQERVKNFLTAHPEVSATAIKTAADSLAVQDRIQAAKAAFRKSIGYSTETELVRMGSDPETAAKIKQAMDQSD